MLSSDPRRCHPSRRLATMTAVAHPPRLTADAAERIADEIFGVIGRATALPSERDQNFLIQDAGGSRAVLKVANAGEDRGVLEAENAAMRHLAPTGLAPSPLATRAGEDIGRSDGHFVRLLTCLDGRPMADAPWHSDALLADLGRAVGLMDRTLATFDHPAVHRRFYWDLAGAATIVEARSDRIQEPALRTRLESLLGVYRTTVAPNLATLRQSVIHGDANDYNVLVDGTSARVTGLVDFGDMVFSHTVNDLAVAMAYAALGKPDPVGAAAAVARGYHGVHPLTEDEIAALFGLLCLRLCLSVCVADAQQAERPGDAYLGISQQPIRETLPRLAEVHPRLAHYRLRDACGFPPVPETPRIVDWLRSHAGRFAPVTGHDLGSTPVLGLDLSAGSPLVSSNPADNAAEPFTRRVFNAMRAANVEIAAGGYDEVRLIYATPAYATGAVTDERRTVHIGLDLTMTAGSPIHAPLDGVVHGFEDAAGWLHYGPVIVLRHEIPGDEPLVFYTLYGHLGRDALDGLFLGKPVRAGERFATIGAPPSNGDWWPHLHFQIVTDLLDVPCNVNGVALASQRRVWLSLSPDPNLILGIPPERFARHPSKAALLSERRLHLGRNLTLSYGDRPLQIVRGWMQYLFDETGRTYIDAYNNVPHVGHAHPRVTEAVAAQLATVNTNTRYLQEVVLEYATELAARFPSPLSVCFFTTSGSEANELALRLARAHTRQRDLVVMDGAYHGHTTTLVDISPYKHAGPGGLGAPDWVHASPIPDVYRGVHKAADPDAGIKYARAAGGVIDRIRERGRGLCGYIAETCPSVAGQVFLPAGFLAEVYRLVREAGGVCIADEVQTGFGRLGSTFWAFEPHGVVPDIVVLGKPIANGYPMGAVVTTPEIAASFDNGMEFFSTFGGSTAACAAGLATLRATIDEGLQAHAARVGAHLLSELRRLQTTHALVGDVRGSGLFIGVELVRDRATLAPAGDEAADIVNRMRELGVLAGTEGPHHNVIKIRGPMPLTTSDADGIVGALERGLRVYNMSGPQG
jgi:4-aminobutyrate aminotransferase-like enzyme/Ser/Thr protein kinase RdoA (MazF antagonist)/murein DD-endopeptidase MepM/ murein hydrolase activator NlpD